MFSRVYIPCLLSMLIGCASVTNQGLSVVDKPLIPPVRLAPDSVVLEIGLVDAPHDDPGWIREVWSEMDEQQFSPEDRRRIQGNGFRAGTIGIQLPIKLRDAIDQRANSARGLLAAISEGENLAQNRRLQTRAGKRSEVVTVPAQPSMIVLTDDGDGVAGKTYHESQTVFAVRSFPIGDGKARIELTPEIQFGPPRQRWTGKDGMFQLEAGREKKAFENLTFRATLTPGHTLVVSSIGGRRSLGGNFFTTKDGRTRLLMIRLAQSQYENLFEPDEAESEPAVLGLTTELD